MPHIYMQDLLGADGMVQRGAQTVRAHTLTKWVLLELLRVWTWVAALVDRDGGRHLHERIGQMFFQG
ncbi:MAG: hypothetical protein ABR606_21130 [Vicinamibacterales bacterium]